MEILVFLAIVVFSFLMVFLGGMVAGFCLTLPPE